MKKNLTSIILFSFAMLCLGIALSLSMDGANNEKEIIQPTIDTTVINICYINYYLAIENIKKHEGLRLNSYQLGDDPYHYVGYGHQIRKNEGHLHNITQEQADSLLEADLLHRVNYMANRYDVTGNEALALGMLIYNVSPTSVNRSGLENAIRQGNVDDIRSIWLSFCNFMGKPHKKLKERREFELNLYLK